MKGAQFWQLYSALIHAYPTEAELAQMVQVDLNENLASITVATNMQERVFDLIHWAEAQGKLADLVLAAQQRNPGNPQLQSLPVPPQPTPGQRERSRVLGTIKYVGQWVLVIAVVLG